MLAALSSLGWPWPSPALSRWVCQECPQRVGAGQGTAELRARAVGTGKEGQLELQAVWSTPGPGLGHETTEGQTPYLRPGMWWYHHRLLLLLNLLFVLLLYLLLLPLLFFLPPPSLFLSPPPPPSLLSLPLPSPPPSIPPPPSSSITTTTTSSSSFSHPILSAHPHPSMCWAPGWAVSALSGGGQVMMRLLTPLLLSFIPFLCRVQVS